MDNKTGGEKPHVVLQQNETESSEAETGSADPYADLLKDPEVMAANKIYVKETAETEKRGSSLREISCSTPITRSWHPS